MVTMTPDYKRLAGEILHDTRAPDHMREEHRELLRALASGKLVVCDAEPVGTLTVSSFRGHLENRCFDYYGDLPDGTYPLHTGHRT